MNLPAADLAIVEPEKVRDYLLSSEHPVGRFKAAFFTRLGYSRLQWRRLQKDILEIARVGQVADGQPSRFGRKFEVGGILRGPSGCEASVVTVWIIRHGEDFPRLITVFPGD